MAQDDGKDKRPSDDRPVDRIPLGDVVKTIKESHIRTPASEKRDRPEPPPKRDKR